MDLAVVHSFLYTRGGAERVVLKIAQHFDAKVFVSRFEPEHTFPEFGELDVVQVGGLVPSLVPEQLPMRVRDAVRAGLKFHGLKLDDFDVVNAQGTPSEWIANRNSPVLWYCHTPNREAFDLYDWRMSRRSFVQRQLYKAAIAPYRVIEGRVLPNIDFIFANSCNTQARIKKFLGRESEVLNPGVDYKDFECRGYEKFFFYPSRIAPEKRFEFAISAFKKFKRDHPGWQLVIAGALIAQRDDHVRYVERLRGLLGDDGKILIDVDNLTFMDLYARCYSVVYTPVNEDFGIVPLEAMAARKPCLAVNEGGPREVVLGGKTGFLVDSVDELASRMAQLAGDVGLVEKMGKNGLKRVKKEYGWGVFLKRFEKRCKILAKKSV